MYVIYKQARNQVTTEMRKCKYEYEKDLAAKIKNRSNVILELRYIKAKNQDYIESAKTSLWDLYQWQYRKRRIIKQILR